VVDEDAATIVSGSACKRGYSTLARWTETLSRTRPGLFREYFGFPGQASGQSAV